MTKNYNIIECFGKNVKKYMEKMSVRVKELSEKTGINEKYIEKIINGEAKGAKMSHGIKIAKVFKIKLHLLFEDEDTNAS